MANADNPHGLRPLRHYQGGAIILAERSKAVGSEPAIFIGDAYNRLNDGTIDSSLSAHTLLISGVALNYGATLTATTHLCIEDPYVVFEAQDNNATDGFAEADMGLNADLVAGAGSAITQISGHEINETGAAETATFDVHLLQKLNVPDNAYGGWCRVEVLFNSHRMHGATVGV
ncbi:MAG: hypothetical protein V1790_17620 [Planctomycetota bacterium]